MIFLKSCILFCFAWVSFLIADFDAKTLDAVRIAFRQAATLKSDVSDELRDKFSMGVILDKYQKIDDDFNRENCCQRKPIQVGKSLETSLFPCRILVKSLPNRKVVSPCACKGSLKVIQTDK